MGLDQSEKSDNDRPCRGGREDQRLSYATDGERPENGQKKRTLSDPQFSESALEQMKGRKISGKSTLLKRNRFYSTGIWTLILNSRSSKCSPEKTKRRIGKKPGHPARLRG